MRGSRGFCILYLVQALNYTWAYYADQINQPVHVQAMPVLLKIKTVVPDTMKMKPETVRDFYDGYEDFDYMEEPSFMQLHDAGGSQTEGVVVPVIMTSENIRPLEPMDDGLLFDYYEFGGPPPDYGGGGWYGPGPPPGPPPQSKPPVKGKPKPKPKPPVHESGGNYGPPPFEGGGGWSEGGPEGSGEKEKDKFSEIKDKWNGLLEKLKLKDKSKDKDKEDVKKPVMVSKPTAPQNPSGPGWGPPSYQGPPPQGPGSGWGPPGPPPPPSRPLNLLEIWIGGGPFADKK